MAILYGGKWREEFGEKPNIPVIYGNMPLNPDSIFGRELKRLINPLIGRVSSKQFAFPLNEGWHKALSVSAQFPQAQEQARDFLNRLFRRN